jgi:nitrogen regulatory protein PII
VTSSPRSFSWGKCCIRYKKAATSGLIRSSFREGGCLKQAQSIIRPDKLDPVKDALVALNITGMTIVPDQGFGRQLGHAEVYRGGKIEARLLPRLMLTLLVNDEAVPGVVEAIRLAAATGEVGDGKIVITDVENAISILTGESGGASV